MGMRSLLQRRTARKAAHSEIPKGEKIHVEGLASFMFSDGVTAVWPLVHIVVADKRVAWAMLDAPRAGAASMRFDRIWRYVDEGGLVTLTERDPEYASMLNDPNNPYGETDAIFSFHGSRVGDILKGVLARTIRGAGHESAVGASPDTDVLPRQLLSARLLDDVPEAVRIGSPYDASDDEVWDLAQKGVLHPQTNYGVVYRVAFAQRLEPREQPITMRVAFSSSVLGSEPPRKPTPDDIAWLLVTGHGLRWHFMVDGVPGTQENQEAPRPAGPRDATYAALQPVDVGLRRELASEAAVVFGGAASDFFGFLHQVPEGEWLHVFALSPGYETDALMNEIHERIAFAR